MAEKGRGNKRTQDRKCRGGTKSECFSLGIWSMESGIQTVKAETLVHSLSLTQSHLFSKEREKWAAGRETAKQCLGC